MAVGAWLLRKVKLLSQGLLAEQVCGKGKLEEERLSDRYQIGADI